jgi:signal transduction histidine kinase
MSDSDIGETEFSLRELREHLGAVVIIVDFGVLVLASIAAYFLARRTLVPIEVVYKKQEQFMGDVAHELRTPLSVMKSGAEATLRKERSGHEYVGFISELLEEVNRMALLTDNLLFLLKHKSEQTVTHEPVDLAQIAASQVKNFSDYAQEKHVTVTLYTEEAAVLDGIPGSFVRLFQNLIKNAIDYNVKGGAVHVQVKTEPDTILVIVSDTGIGMSSTDQNRVFERFYKADTARTHTKNSGTGLGLSIVRDIVYSHQGTITLQSAPGEGTTFTIQFPRTA